MTFHGHSLKCLKQMGVQWHSCSHLCWKCRCKIADYLSGSVAYRADIKNPAVARLTCLIFYTSLNINLGTNRADRGTQEQEQFICRASCISDLTFDIRSAQQNTSVDPSGQKFRFHVILFYSFGKHSIWTRNETGIYIYWNVNTQ